MIFPKSEFKILRLIYENPGIRLNELIKKARVSVTTAKERLGHLSSLNAISEEKITGGKRVILKNFFPNLDSEEGKNIFSLIESEKKQEFFKKNKYLLGSFNQILKNSDEEIKIILVFGSFASNSQTKDSDLDILFLTDKKINKNNLKKEIERSFVTFNRELSPRIDTINNFRKNINSGVYQTILKNHIIIKGNINYLELIK